MQHIIRPAVPIFLLLLLAMQTCFAEVGEDMRFVDARGNTGYYVNPSTISVDSDHEYTAQIAVVKAGRNREFLYYTHFDYAARTYQILNAAVCEYDTGKVLEKDDAATDPRGYSSFSAMQSIVDYIYALENGGNVN
jgi:uncharacterized repeat protein (TIGR04076 family)